MHLINHCFNPSFKSDPRLLLMSPPYVIDPQHYSQYYTRFMNISQEGGPARRSTSAYQLNNASFSIDQPGRILSLERLGLSGLQASHYFTLERTQRYKGGREIGADGFHMDRRRPMAVIQQPAIVDITFYKYQSGGSQLLL